MTKILVIGNGFDLSLGYRTSYPDFLDWIESNKKVQSNGFLHWIKKKQSIDRWVDVELELGRYVNSLGSTTQINKLHSSDARTVKTQFWEIRKELSSYLTLATQNSHQIKDSSAFTKLRDFFKRTQSSAERGLILNFNYTDTALRLLSTYVDPGDPKLTHQFVHGSLLNRDEIFGVHDGFVANEYPFIEKSASSTFSGHVRNLLTTASSVDIFGHSLGVTDKFYFENYFEWIASTQNSSHELTISFHGDDGEDSLNIALNTLSSNKRSALKANLKRFTAESV